MPKVKVRAKLLESVCVVDVEGRQANLDWVTACGLPICRQLPERIGQLAIVASGPSVREHLNELREWPGEIWAINGAYDYLLDNGIVPHGFFAIDPLPGLAEYVQHANSKTVFYIGSTCDPSVFEALKDFQVQVFHPAGEDMTYPDGWVIGGGTTALTRVPYLALLQGWRDMMVFGADSSFDGGEYCYQWGRYACDISTPKVRVEIGGEIFETELGLMKQVSQLGIIVKKLNGRLKFRCGGLLDAFLRAPTIDDSFIEMDDGRKPSVDAT